MTWTYSKKSYEKTTIYNIRRNKNIIKIKQSFQLFDFYYWTYLCRNERRRKIPQNGSIFEIH